MFKIILVVLLLAVAIVLGVWSFSRDKVDTHFVNGRGDLQDWSEEIPVEVPPYLGGKITNSTVKGKIYTLVANSTTQETQKYYNQFLSQGWGVAIPLELNEDVTSSNRAKVQKGNLYVEISLSYGTLYISGNLN